MDQVNADFIERYQKIYEQDPKSKVFAPLAEAYRKMGLLQEAKTLCQDGLKANPHFAGGHVALAKVHLELKEPEKALKNLNEATRLSPENFLAHELLAQCHLLLKDPKEALKAYKMLLFLDPQHSKAQRAVKKLESLTADEYESDAFDMKPVSHLVKEWEAHDESIHLEEQETQPNEKLIRNLERYTSLIDAFIVRNDIDRALETLNDAENLIGSHPEFVKRLKLIQQRTAPPARAESQNREPTSQDEAPLTRESEIKKEKVQLLENLLLRVREHSSKGN